jgi:hypothetical protein
MFSEILWFKGFWSLLWQSKIEMQISLRRKRKIPKWDRKLWKWLCYIKSRIICSASDLPGVEVVPFLHDLRWREGEIELCRIWTVQWILRMKASLCFIFSCSVAPQLLERTLNSESCQCQAHQEKVTFLHHETSDEKIWYVNW